MAYFSESLEKAILLPDLDLPATGREMHKAY